MPLRHKTAFEDERETYRAERRLESFNTFGRTLNADPAAGAARRKDLFVGARDGYESTR